MQHFEKIVFECECSSIKSGNGKYPVPAMDVSGVRHVDQRVNNVVTIVIAFVLTALVVERLW